MNKIEDSKQYMTYGQKASKYLAGAFIFFVCLVYAWVLWFVGLTAHGPDLFEKAMAIVIILIGLAGVLTISITVWKAEKIDKESPAERQYMYSWLTSQGFSVYLGSVSFYAPNYTFTLGSEADVVFEKAGPGKRFCMYEYWMYDKYCVVKRVNQSRREYFYKSSDKF